MIYWTDYLKYLPMAAQFWVDDQLKRNPRFVLLMTIFITITMVNLIFIGLRSAK